MKTFVSFIFLIFLMVNLSIAQGVKGNGGISIEDPLHDRVGLQTSLDNQFRFQENTSDSCVFFYKVLVEVMGDLQKMKEVDLQSEPSVASKRILYYILKNQNTNSIYKKLMRHDFELLCEKGGILNYSVVRSKMVNGLNDREISSDQKIKALMELLYLAVDEKHTIPLNPLKRRYQEYLEEAY